MLHRKSSLNPTSRLTIHPKVAILSAAVALAVAGVSSTSLRADTAATWTGANSLSNGYWANSANWNGNIIGNNGVPSGAVYDVTVPNATVGADLSGISPTIGQLTLGSTETIYNSNGTGAGAETLTIDPSTMTTPSGSTISGTVGNSGGSLITLDIGDGHASTAATTISGLLTGDVSLVVAQSTGMVTLSNTSNNYTGGTILDAGTLAISGSTLGTGAVIFNGGTLQTTAGITDSQNFTINAGGGTVDTAGQSDTFSGNLTGAGGLIVESTSGNGVLTLTGTGNTYTGGTTVESGTLVSAVGSGLGGGSEPLTIGTNGTLQLDNVFQNISTLNGTGSIQLGASTLLNVTGSSPSSFGGVMSGSGSFRVAGTNTVTLSGANTYSGTTTIASGTLEFTGSTSSLTGNIIDNAALVFSQNANSSASGIISGTGTVIQQGTSTLILSGTNTYSGGTTINGGTLSVSADSNLGATSGAVTLGGGTLAYTGSGGTIANAITTSGAGTTNVLTNSSTGTETLTGSVTNATAGNILAFSGGTFNLNEAGSGSGTFEIGDAPSTVIVSNANAFGSGAIIVNSGSTLETSDALAGSGSVLAITGSSYTQNSGSTLKLLATGNGVNDSIALGNGTASLNGELNLIFSGFTPTAGQHYTVISTSGGVTGNFSSIVLTGAPSLMVGMGSVVSGTGEVIDLSYSAYFANTSSFNANESSLATYLNNNAVSSNTPAPIQNALIALSSMSSQQQAQYLDALTPQAYSQLQEQSIQNNTFMAQQLFNQLQSSFDGGGFNTSGLMMLKTTDQNPFAVSMDSALASAQQQAHNSVAYMDNSSQLVGMPGVGPLVPNQESPLSKLSGFVLGTITVDQLQQNNTPTQHFTTGSVMAGLDYRLNRNLVIGGLFNWGYTGGTMDNVGSRQRSSSYTPGVFVGYKQGGFYADGLMSYTYNSYQINRNVNMPGSSSIATGEPDSNEYDANALVGYYLPIARGFQAGPAVGAGFTQINTSGYSETGSPFDLTVAKQHADSLRSLLGMQALYSFAPENNPLPISINFNAFWQHEFLNSSRNINASFTQLGGGNFIYNTAGPSRDSALLGLGASGYINKQISLFVNYETQVGDHRQFAQTVMAGVAVSF